MHVIEFWWTKKNVFRKKSNGASDGCHPRRSTDWSWCLIFFFLFFFFFCTTSKVNKLSKVDIYRKAKITAFLWLGVSMTSTTSMFVTSLHDFHIVTWRFWHSFHTLCTKWWIFQVNQAVVPLPLNHFRIRMTQRFLFTSCPGRFACLESMRSF